MKFQAITIEFSPASLGTKTYVLAPGAVLQYLNYVIQFPCITEFKLHSIATSSFKTFEVFEVIKIEEHYFKPYLLEEDWNDVNQHVKTLEVKDVYGKFCIITKYTVEDKQAYTIQSFGKG